MSSPVNQLTPLHECPYMAESISELNQEVARLANQLAAKKAFVKSILGKKLSAEQCQGVLDAIVELEITITPTEEYLAKTARRTADFLKNTGLPVNRDRAAEVVEQVGIIRSLAEDLRYHKNLLKTIIAPPEGADTLLFRSFSQQTFDSKILATYGDESTPENVKTFETLPPNRYRSFADSDDNV